MSKCNKCNKNFLPRSRKVGCGFCGKWYHIDCGNVTEQLFNIMSENPQIHWYCTNCNEKATEILAVVQNCVKETEDVKKDVKNLQGQVKGIKEGTDETFMEMIRKMVKEEIDKERENAVPTVHQSSEAVREIARKEVRENNDKKGRENNIVISGIDEEADEEKEVEDLLTFLGVAVEVNAIRRMGKEKKADRIRNVWVQLASKKERNSVLDKAKNLRNEDKWNAVYINRDMTEEERKEAYNLRVELRKKRREVREANGSEEYIIFRGRVIKKGTEREQETEEDGSPVDVEEQD